MTYHEFLSALRKRNEKWMLLPKGEIRLEESQGLCPGLVCGIFGKKNIDFAWMVATAADNKTGNLGLSEYTPKFDPAIRADLLSACGLAEAN